VLPAWGSGSGSPISRSIESSTTHEPVDQAGPERVRVVHAFHPWFGRDLEFVKRRRRATCRETGPRGSDRRSLEKDLHTAGTSPAADRCPFRE
jgi:hypothetical protein